MQASGKRTVVTLTWILAVGTACVLVLVAWGWLRAMGYSFVSFGPQCASSAAFISEGVGTVQRLAPEGASGEVLTSEQCEHLFADTELRVSYRYRVADVAAECQALPWRFSRYFGRDWRFVSQEPDSGGWSCFGRHETVAEGIGYALVTFGVKPTGEAQILAEPRRDL